MEWQLFGRQAITRWKPNSMDIVFSITWQLPHSTQSTRTKWVAIETIAKHLHSFNFDRLKSIFLNLQLERVLIVDYDLHHGQGTQQMFINDPRVLYFSIHRYEYGQFWPNLPESDYDTIGEGKGKGFNFNVPLNKTGMSNADYLAIWQQILLPVAVEVLNWRKDVYLKNIWKKNWTFVISLRVVSYSLNPN